MIDSENLFGKGNNNMSTRVERSGIEDCIFKINNAIDALSSAAAEIERTMNELPSYWEGAAYENARTTYEEQYQTLLITTVPESVSSFRDYINTCMEKIIEIDEELAGV